MGIDKDGTVKVELSGDELSAVAFITPPVGFGKEVDVMDVKRALKEAGVVFGIVNNERIQAFCQEGRLTPVDFLVASGTPPGQGTDASVVYSWMKQDEAPKEEQGGKVDLRELDIIKSVAKNEVIAIKTPPTRGEPGRTVTGKEALGEWGTDIALKSGANVSVSEDGLQFMAMAAGSPRVHAGVISVDPVYTISGDVDYSTGNINFAGALEIRGSVIDGFIVKADGNITIGGNVQACQIMSGGNIVVRGGIITRNEGVVSASGTITARFIENSIVEAEQDVVVERAIINSSVRSNRSVVCISKEGKIMGGDIMAFQEIRARQIGTEKETKTTLRAGFKYDVYLKLAELEVKLEEVSNEAARLQSAVSSSKTSPDNIAEMKSTLAKLESDKLSINHRIAALRSRVQVNPFATIKGEDYIHPGCLVYIGGSRERVTKTLKYATLSSDREGGISLSSYDELTRSIKTTSVGTKEKKITVMIVDDAKFMRGKLRNILENCNFHVVGEAEDGRQAVQLFGKLKPDITTMDITMPNVDGITSLKAIKKISPDAKVVMISAIGQKEKVRDSILAGAMDFIIKPFVPERVIEVVTRIAAK